MFINLSGIKFSCKLVIVLHYFCYHCTWRCVYIPSNSRYKHRQIKLDLLHSIITCYLVINKHLFYKFYKFDNKHYRCIYSIPVLISVSKSEKPNCAHLAQHKGNIRMRWQLKPQWGWSPPRKYIKYNEA